MENSIPNEIVRGHINTIILSSLVEGDKYGYEIRKEIEAKSQGSFVLKEPTLYSSLKRLEKQGFVEAYYGDDASHGGRRKYYKLTEYGREVTLKNLNEWKYSRSLIDKLITEEKVDLQNTPPPENLGLNITKKVSKKYADTKSNELKETEPESKETKFVFDINSLEPPKKIKSSDPIIQSSQIFGMTDEDEKASKEYKNLMDKLISTTKTHMVNFEDIKAVEKVKSEESIKEDIKEEKKEKVSYSLLPKVEDTSFLKTQAKIQSEGFKIRTFTKEKSKGYKQLVLINKLLFWTMLLTFAAMLLELIIVYFVFEKQINLGPNPYLIITACLVTLPLFGAVLCIVDPNRKIKAKLNISALIIYSLLLFAFGFLIILSIRLITQQSFKDVNLKDVVTGIILPTLLLFNILTSTFFYALLHHSRKFHV